LLQWSVENSLDNMARSGRDIHNNNPGEEMNYHGSLNTTNQLLGANYGYPSCHAVWEASSVQGIANVKVGTQMIQNTASGSITDAYCQSTPQPPRLTFPAHTAPLDIKFRRDGSAAYISFHGSWNRNPPDGYRLSRIDFGADGQPKEPSTSTTAEVRVMWNANNANCPNRCFRPCGLAFDGKERLFMTSDTSNELWVVTGA
jgi:glucose/arabinose dehydrogenase